MTISGSGPVRLWKQQLLPLLANLRLAILLLLAIAAASIAGTVIEQGQPLSFYQANYPEEPALFGFLSWQVLMTLGLHQVYQTWWFMGLLVLFGSSLIACTFTRQLPALRAARGWKYYQRPSQFAKLAYSTTLTAESLSGLQATLTQRRYRVFAADNTLYARKGLMGRIGPIVVHVSLILVLLGAIWGSLTGFMAQELVPSGETFQIEHIVQAGPWSASHLPQDWSVKVNRFWIDYTPEGKIDQFYSDLSVLDQNDAIVDRQTIHVNKPLTYQGVTLYQADWAVAAIQVTLNRSPVLQLSMAPLSLEGGGRIWGTWVPTQPDLSAGVSVLARDLQGTVLIYDSTGKLVTTLRRGMSVTLEGIQLTLVDVVGSTGLQIKADPGIPLIYLGFGLLMVGVLMSYVSHSQVWALLEGETLYVGGRTNRAQITFEQEFLDVVGQLPRLTPELQTPQPSGS